MTEISNRALAVLFTAAIVVSIFGTLLNISRLESLDLVKAPFETLQDVTGLAQGNDSGLVNFTISEVTELILDVDIVDFGSGYVANNSIFCNLSTVSQSNASTSPCVGFYNTSIPDALHLRNAGNKNVSVTLYINNNTNTWFNCGSGQGCGDGDSAIAINVSNNQSGACGFINLSFGSDGVGDTVDWGIMGNWTHPASVYDNVLFYPDQTFSMICGNETDPQLYGLDWTPDQNTLDIDVFVAMWLNATGNSQGQKSISLTFVGDSS